MDNKILVEQINMFMWLNLTSNDALSQELDKNISKLLEKSEDKNLRFASDGSGGKKFSIGEMIILEKISTLFLDIIVSQNQIKVDMENNETDEPFECLVDNITDATDALKKIRKAHPDGISFFYIKENDIISKFCPYYFISTLILYKIGFFTGEISLS